MRSANHRESCSVFIVIQHNFLADQADHGNSKWNATIRIQNLPLLEIALLLYTERLLSAGHDISDGGLITCVMEMAFAGNCGIEVDIITKEPGETMGEIVDGKTYIDEVIVLSIGM